MLTCLHTTEKGTQMTIQPYVFTASEINGDALRVDFLDKFLEEGSADWSEGPIEDLIELFVEQLGEAKRKWASIDCDAEIADMERWLSERGYIAPEYREF